MPETSTRRPTPLDRTALALAALTALVVAAMVGAGAAHWIGQSFPGFFVLPNRVVPSIGREDWSSTRDGTIFQRTIVAVDGRRVADSADAYRAVAAKPAGADVTYTLRHGSTDERVRLETHTFSRADYWIIFGSYLATGLAYLWLGVLAAWLLPGSRLGRALLLVGGIGGIYALTGAGIYEPNADLRLHALAEALFPATFVSLALVLAADEQPFAKLAQSLAWWLSLALAVSYQLLLGQPGAYTLVHGACETYLGVAGLGVGCALLIERARAADQAGPLLRSAVAGAVLGIGVPAVVMTLSGLSGGGLPINLMTATAFLFPLCLGYGLVREHSLGRPVARRLIRLMPTDEAPSRACA